MLKNFASSNLLLKSESAMGLSLSNTFGTGKRFDRGAFSTNQNQDIVRAFVLPTDPWYDFNS